MINAGIGCAYGNIGDHPTAAGYLEDALAGYPELSSGTLDLIGVYWAMDRKEDARALVARVRQKMPDLTCASYLRESPKFNIVLAGHICNALRDGGVPQA